MTRRPALVFWASLATLGATYAGGPAVLALRAARRPRPHRPAPIEPTVSIVIAAHDEEASIGTKLDHLHALDWPADRLEIVVVSDGSTDATEAIVAGHADRGVRLIARPWEGKAAALDAGVAATSGDIVVFTDANSLLAPDALRCLTRHFADPEVGCVAGNQRYLADSATTDGSAATGDASGGERSYWALDRLLKTLESRAGDAISATGALYAIRRELIQPVRVGVTDDFWISTGAVVAGQRIVFDPEAVAWEPPAASSSAEYARKVRVMTRGLRGVVARRELLDPRRHGGYALQLWWHKVLRRLMVFPLIGLALSAPLAWRRGPTYRAATIGQAGFYALAAVGTLRPGRGGRLAPLFSLPAYFCLVNAAALRAVINLVTGRRIDRWQVARPAEELVESPSG